MSLGGLYLEGLIHGGAYFRNFTVFDNQVKVPFFMLQQFLITDIARSNHRQGVRISHDNTN